jgi:mono/diheme cytochrome c family protein
MWQKAKAILQARCTACHGNPASKANGLFGAADDLNGLKAKGKVIAYNKKDEFWQ